MLIQLQSGFIKSNIIEKKHKKRNRVISSLFVLFLPLNYIAYKKLKCLKVGLHIEKKTKNATILYCQRLLLAEIICRGISPRSQDLLTNYNFRQIFVCSLQFVNSLLMVNAVIFHGLFISLLACSLGDSYVNSQRLCIKANLFF